MIIKNNAETPLNKERLCQLDHPSRALTELPLPRLQGKQRSPQVILQSLPPSAAPWPLPKRPPRASTTGGLLHRSHHPKHGRGCAESGTARGAGWGEQPRVEQPPWPPGVGRAGCRDPPPSVRDPLPSLGAPSLRQRPPPRCSLGAPRWVWGGPGRPCGGTSSKSLKLSVLSPCVVALTVHEGKTPLMEKIIFFPPLIWNFFDQIPNSHFTSSRRVPTLFPLIVGGSTLLGLDYIPAIFTSATDSGSTDTAFVFSSITPVCSSCCAFLHDIM